MPVEINGTKIMGDDGKFTPDFKPEMLGPEYAESKLFETTPDITTLMKVAHDSKSALGKKLENHIEKPGENATEEQLAEYNKMLRKELGAPEKPEDYVFPVPDGAEVNEESDQYFRNVFHELGIPKSDAEALVAKFNEYQQQQLQQIQAAEDSQFELELTAYKSSHAGSTLVADTRVALKAMLQFIDGDFKQQLQESKLVENPTDFDGLRKLNIWPSQLAVWHSIGKAMKSDEYINNEGKPSNLNSGPAKGSREETVARTYDHPTSVADRKARGLSA